MGCKGKGKGGGKRKAENRIITVNELVAQQVSGFWSIMDARLV